MTEALLPNVLQYDLQALIDSENTSEEVKALAEEMLANTYSTTGFVLGSIGDNNLDATIADLDKFLKGSEEVNITKYILLIRLLAQAEGVEFDTESVTLHTEALKNYLKYCISEKLYRNGLSKYDSRVVSIFDLSKIQRPSSINLQ